MRGLFSPPLPSHPLLSFSSPFPFPSSPSFPLPTDTPVPCLPLPLEVGPLLWLEGLEEHLSSPSRSGQSTAAKRFLLNWRLKIATVVAMVLTRFTRHTSTWSIAKNAIRYLVRQPQRIIYCAMGPECFSAVMVRNTTAQSERHNKSNASVVLQGDFSRL